MSEKMKKIGIVVAIEIDAVLARYGEPKRSEVICGRTVRMYDSAGSELYVIEAGAGEIASASATQLLIARYGVDMIMNFGVVGALTQEMSTAELCVVDSVIHYDFDTTGWLDLPRGMYPGEDSAYIPATAWLADKALELQPDLRRVVCASADKFVADAGVKSSLHETYGADICEMEAAGIVLTCRRCDVPCLLIKAVSDSLTGGGAEFFTELRRVSGICFDVLDSVIQAM